MNLRFDFFGINNMDEIMRNKIVTFLYKRGNIKDFYNFTSTVQVKVFGHIVTDNPKDTWAVIDGKKCEFWCVTTPHYDSMLVSCGDKTEILYEYHE